jgi:flagellar biosynthesis protein FliQ
VLAIKDWTIFFYYPLTQEVSRTRLTVKSGPSMHWYAWIVTAFVIASVLSAIVPRSWTKSLDRSLAWIPAVLAIIAILVFEKKWFV